MGRNLNTTSFKIPLITKVVSYEVTFVLVYVIIFVHMY